MSGLIWICKEPVPKHADSVANGDAEDPLTEKEVAALLSTLPSIDVESQDKNGLVDKIFRAIERVGSFFNRHYFLKVAVEVGAPVLGLKAADRITRSSGSAHESETVSVSQNSSVTLNDANLAEKDELPLMHDYPEVRSSPHEHEVSGYYRQQNGKTVYVRGYKRGQADSED